MITIWNGHREVVYNYGKNILKLSDKQLNEFINEVWPWVEGLLKIIVIGSMDNNRDEEGGAELWTRYENPDVFLKITVLLKAIDKGEETTTDMNIEFKRFDTKDEYWIAHTAENNSHKN